MEINIVFRIAAVGILVAVLHQVLMRAGREEQAMLTTLAGLVVVLFWVIQYISQLFDTVQTLFQLWGGGRMEIGKIIAIGLVGTIFAVLLKKENPQLAMLLAAVTGILIFGIICVPLGRLIGLLRETAETAGVGDGYFAVVLKVIGIAYLTQFGAQLCADAGEGTVAAKIELAGKILMMTAAAPVLIGLLELVMGLV